MADLYLGDCMDILPTIPSESVDVVLTDSPYPCIKRDYGYWTEAEWWALIVEGVIPQVRRILKPTGSAVFILQPNSEHVGQMRGWLWEFMAWVCREWNMVQDAYWWNYACMPTVFCRREYGLMRPAMKLCIWAGEPTCYRHQDNVLWGIDKSVLALDLADRMSRKGYPSTPKTVFNPGRIKATVLERGGATPQNVFPIVRDMHAGIHGHGAGTPLALADWWVRYICPPGGTVLDPFVGSGTMMLAAIKNGCNGIGIDKEQRYIEIAQARIAAAQAEMVQMEIAGA